MGSSSSTAKDTQAQPWDGTAMPSQRGKIAVVTGANTGLGFEAARRLAERGAHVILACRSEARGSAAAAAIQTHLDASADETKGTVELMVVDIGSLASIRAFAEAFRARFDRLDLLVNNAGVWVLPDTKSTDGLSIQFGVNHLGHFYLTTLLFDALKASESARVVNVSSVGHRMMVGRLTLQDTTFDLSTLASGGKDNDMTRYDKSKLCNLLFTYEMDRRLRAAGIHNIRSVAAHPGVTYTDIFDTTSTTLLPKFLSKLAIKLFQLILQDPEKGTLPILYAATELDVQSGEYFGPDGALNYAGFPTREVSTKASRDELLAQQLWALSEDLTNTPFSVK